MGHTRRRGSAHRSIRAQTLPLLGIEESRMGITNFTVLAALALGLSLVIERTLEIMKAAYDLTDSRLGLYNFWTGRAIVIRDYLQRRVRAMEYVEPEAVQQF